MPLKSIISALGTLKFSSPDKAERFIQPNSLHHETQGFNPNLFVTKQSSIAEQPLNQAPAKTQSTIPRRNIYSIQPTNASSGIPNTSHFSTITFNKSQKQSPQK